MAIERASGGDGSGFSQQFDWGQIASRAVSFTLDVLSRLSAANVDPYTFEIGRLLGSHFELSQTGRQNVITALNQLRCYGTVGDIVWFGFGARHVVRAMPSTNEGMACLALCGVLSEYYHENVSSEVFHEIVKTFNAPPESTPSILQWRALIQSCAGVFSRTSFGVLLDQMMQCNPYRPPGPPMWIETSKLRHNSVNSTPKSVAEVLRAIGAISRGDLKAVTIRGGNDAAWIGAICIWLYGLTVILCDADGRVLFSDCGGQQPQVKIVFRKRHASDMGTQPQEGDESQQLECVEKTFILIDTTEVITRRNWSVEGGSGRVPWDRLFGTVFGPEFDYLMRNQRQGLATAIGSAARLLYGVVHAEEGVPTQLLAVWPNYTQGSYGHNYIQTLTEWFPELACLKGSADVATRESFLMAKSHFEQQMALLQGICGCAACTDQIHSAEHLERFCYQLLVETILVMGLLMSELEVEEGLFPKRWGVERIYRRQFLKRDTDQVDGYWRPALVDELGPFAFIYRDPQNRSDISASEVAFELFTGRKEDDSAPLLAFSVRGICAYLGILNEFTDDLDISGKIHIIPGAISHHGKPYKQISDGHLSRDTISLDTVQLYNKATLNVTESAETLEAWFEVSGNRHASGLATFDVSPATLIADLKTARGWVFCNNLRCRSVAVLLGDENLETDVLGTKVRIVRGNSIARCVALIVGNRLGYRCILKSNECIQCCVRTGLAGMKFYDYMDFEWEGVENQDRGLQIMIISNKGYVRHV